tara:strand:+ start:6533 stop:7231 length:699 start_codon:yes stop_codon:yes gene_type:complete
MTAQLALAELQQFADPVKAEHSKRFFKSGKGEYGEGEVFLGINVPNQRIIAKKYSQIPLPEIEILLQNKYHEARLTAVMLLVYRIQKSTDLELDEVVQLYLKNLEFVNNWDLVDSSCHQILGRFLEHKERDLLYDLATSDNLWERRIAMITCFYFIRKKDFDDALAIAEILLNDNHDLIHKAVGWMIREIGNRDLKVETQFLDLHFKKMPRTMLRYAIEKFEEPLRLHYLLG